MSTWNLVLRSLRHFWRGQIGVVLGVACATAVLVGALAVGDSVRTSLRQQALERIGRVDAALSVHERTFGANLAARVAAGLAGARTAAALQFQGVVSKGGGEARAGIVDVFGVGADFFALSPRGVNVAPPATDGAFLNRRLANHLGVAPGDTVLVRVPKPSAMPKDMALATVDDVSFALRLDVERVLDDADFGAFSLRASQVPPFNLFVPLGTLQKRLELDGRANLVVVADGGEDVARRASAAVREAWTLDDVELAIEPLPASAQFELKSDRVFLDRVVADALARTDPSLVGVLTYFVNTIRNGDRETPYSMISAIGRLGETPEDSPPVDFLPADLGQGQIIVNDWLASDLGVAVGDLVELDYYVAGEQLRLDERTSSFVVRAIVPLTGSAADRTLMPAFPGLHDAESCRDWEPGVPVDRQRLDDADQDYWDVHRGTPKAFVGLEVGRGLWANRFGSLTAVRGPVSAGERVERDLRRTFDPAELGLFFFDVRGPALAASSPATDFGGLFLGLSFFLIVAALLLTSLLFVFGVEGRANEIGTLLAIGFRPKRVRRLFLVEALLVAAIGGVIGAAFGLGYTRAVLYGLGTLWRDAVGATTLTFHAGFETVATGVVLAIATALFAIWLALRKTFDRPATELLASRNGIPAPSVARHRARFSPWIALFAIVGAFGLALTAGDGATQAAMTFFGAGALFLIGGIAASRGLLVAFGAGANIGSVTGLGVRNTGRRPGRSLATIALLASGTFLVVAVQANRLEPPLDFAQRSSGTGGFALFGRSTLPVLRDLESSEGRDAYGLDDDELGGVAIVPLRVRDGDDASCLNLSRPQNPRLIGVQPAELADRGAFEFQSMLRADGTTQLSSPWLALDMDYGLDVVPAIGDAASVTWTLHKSVGDSLEYRDERGQPFLVMIVGTVANSILQGNLIVSERHFEARFPSTSGYQMFLIDAPRDRIEPVTSSLTDAFEDIGLELTSTADRLRTFNAVQNTYLLIFQALGGLGLLLGSVGLGTVVLRNALERRGELALASAVGFPVRAVRRLLWCEHGLLLGLGLLTGLLSALVAVVPGAAETSLVPVVSLVAAVTLSGMVWVWAATVLATRGPLLDALRGD